MEPSTRTPEGEPNRCAVCGKALHIEPSRPPGDAPCPHCGTLLWFSADPSSPPTTAWQCGAEMLQQGEIAAGLAAWQNVVAHKPHDLAPRQTLRETERKLHAEHVSDDESAAAALTEIWWAIHQAKHKRADKFIDWDAVDRAAEQGLAIDPTDVELHLELAHACRARGYRDVAQFAYHCALELAPGRADIKQQLAELSE